MRNMKKNILILGSSLAALSALAYVDITGITTPLPTSGSSVSITESMIGAILSGGMTYNFDADGVMIVHSGPIPRHVSSTITFNTNGHTGLTVASSAISSNFGKWYYYYGYNNPTITGGGEISFDTTEGATPVWYNSMIIDATTVNMNLAPEKFLRAGGSLGSATTTLRNGATLNWNSANPIKFYVNGKDSSTEGTWVDNTSAITFNGSGSTFSTVNFSSAALTNVDGVGDVLLNFASSGNVYFKFDDSLGSDIVMYNNSGTRLGNSARVQLSNGKTLTYKASSDSVAAISELVVSSVSVSSRGTYVLDFNGEMASINQESSSTRGFVKIAAGRNISLTNRLTSNSVELEIDSGASLTSKGDGKGTSTAGNNIMGTLTMNEGSSFTIAGGLRTYGMNIDGAIAVNGTGRKTSAGVDDFIVGFNVGTYSTITNKYLFGENATFTQAYQSDGAKNWTSIARDNASNNLTGLFIVDSAAGSINFGNELLIARGTSFTLNSTDAFVLGSGEAWGATSQATSVFTFADYALSSSVEALTRDLFHEFTINAANNIGAFSFDSAYRRVKLIFGESGSLTLGAAEGEYFNSLRGAYLTDDCVVLDGEVINKLRVYDLTEAQIAQYFAVADEENYILNITAADANSYWVNAIAIPEPAEWAFIFGALALGFAAYRRRR